MSYGDSQLINVFGDTAIVIDVNGHEHWLSIEHVTSIKKDQSNPKMINLSWYDITGNSKTVKVSITMDEAKEILGR